MKILKRMTAICLSCFLLVGVFACDKGSSDEPLYQIEDVVKADLMWDTETLFETVPEIQTLPEIRLAKNIEAFKFKSTGYQAKTNTWVFGAIGTPSTAMPKDGYPAVVLIHGGGGYVFRDWILYWMRKGFVAIAIDMFSNQLNDKLAKVTNPDGGPGEHDGSNFDGVDNVTDSWVYHSVHNVIMANNILRERADVDKERIVATGISWGGYITNIVSGVDKRFTAFAPVYGAGFVYEDSFWTNGHGTFGGTENRQQWIELYDPSSYVPYSTKPMLYVSGINDICFAVTNRQKTANLAKGKVFYSQRSNFNHYDSWDATYEIYAFFRHVLYGEDTITQISDILVENGKATLQTQNDKFHSVNFLYTTSTDADSHNWIWQVKPVIRENGVYSCDIPAGATAFLFETIGNIVEKDKDGLFRQSTPVYFTTNI